MSSPQATNPFRFLKVEEFFDDHEGWDSLRDVVAHRYVPRTKTLVLELDATDEGTPTRMILLLQFFRSNTLRVRFNPGRRTAEEYPSASTRTLVEEDEAGVLSLVENHSVFVCESPDAVELTTTTDRGPVMRVRVGFRPFTVEIYKHKSKDETFLVMADATPGIYFRKNRIDAATSFDHSIIQVKRQPVTARYLGLGEQGGSSLYKNTSQHNFFNYDNYLYNKVYGRGPLSHREPLYHADPFFIEVNGVPGEQSVVGLFIDNTSQVLMDFGYTGTGTYRFGTRFGDLDYYVFVADDCAGVLDAFTAFVGKPALAPRWALGYHQGCYGYGHRDEVLRVAQAYRDHRIPIDGLHIDIELQKDYQNFTVDPGRFPDPGGMFDELKRQGFKCATNITPFVSRRDSSYKTYREGAENKYFVMDVRESPAGRDAESYQYYEGGSERWNPERDLTDSNYGNGEPYIGRVAYAPRDVTGHFPDLGRREVRDWWGDQYKDLFDMGLEMVWQDMTTPALSPDRGDMASFPFKLHVWDNSLQKYEETRDVWTAPAIKVWNLYSYNLHKATYSGMLKHYGRGEKRPFILGRGAFAGMARYAALWTGDNASSWDFLHITVSQMLAIGLSGQPLSGADVGGFTRGVDWRSWETWTEPELLIRWTVAGAFFPWFRNHYDRNGNKRFQEPFEYDRVASTVGDFRGRRMHEAMVPVCRHYIGLRYRLLQLFYDALFESTITGLPICRTMALTDPQDTSLYNDKVTFLDNQFLVRGDLLVAPVLEPESRANGGGKRDIYLPQGSDWYVFMDNRRPLGRAIPGGVVIHEYDASITSGPDMVLDPDHVPFIVPIYVRAGAIIPTIELEQYVGERHARGETNPITLNVYPGREGAYTMFLDDGESRASAAPKLGGLESGTDPRAQGAYRSVEIRHAFSGEKRRRITVQRKTNGYTPREPSFFVAVLHDPGEAEGPSGPLRSVAVNGAPARLIEGGSPEERADRLAAATDVACYYNEKIHISFVKVLDDRDAISIEVEYV